MSGWVFIFFSLQVTGNHQNSNDLLEKILIGLGSAIIGFLGAFLIHWLNIFQNKKAKARESALFFIQKFFDKTHDRAEVFALFPREEEETEYDHIVDSNQIYKLIIEGNFFEFVMMFYHKKLADQQLIYESGIYDEAKELKKHVDQILDAKEDEDCDGMIGEMRVVRKAWKFL